MFSLVGYLWKKRERELEMKKEMLDVELSYLEVSDSADFGDLSGEEVIRDEKEKKNNFNMLGARVNSVPGMVCAKNIGCVTKIGSNGGAIDNFVYFDSKCASTLFHELIPGCIVEYITYQKEGNDFIKVVRISKILEKCWDEVSNSKIQETVRVLKNGNPTYLQTQVRNILGIILLRFKSSITAETDYGNFTIEFDDVDINFIPREGDRICLECNVQLDDHYLDLHGEILEVFKVFPTRKVQEEKYFVEGLSGELIVLNDNAYCLNDDVSSGVELYLGDTVKVDLIECQYKNYTHRAISLNLLERRCGQRLSGNNITNPSTQAVTIFGDYRIIIVGLGKTKSITLKVKNNLQRLLRLDKIEVRHKNGAQLKIREPVDKVSLNRYESFNWVIEAKSLIIGTSKEIVSLCFDKFRVTRDFCIVVCETEEESLRIASIADSAAVSNNSQILEWPKKHNRSMQNRCYANHVWSTEQELVPGRHLYTKRRFVTRRLGQYEVPQRLRQISLVTDRRIDILVGLQNEYPFLTETLSIKNYRQRFSTFLHLEEIDCFINIRAYDRDRAYFQRDGDYLCLKIDNLAERRPSLVLGDSVRAYNPWHESTKNENKAYEGIVHKVLFDRILLRFTSSFQERYNGEDYRLEFFFSRLGFRKQHYAIEKAVDKMGKEFLFPSKINKRQQPQLSVTMENGVMKHQADILPWFNTNLNSIQKQAVYNILRGEAENMPYIIFGPPGTGKTVTMVETILQLMCRLPNARLLVGAPSNSSADLIARRIVESNVLTQGDLIRLVSQNHIEKELIPSDLVAYCATVDIGSDGTCNNNMVVTESGLKLRCQVKFMGSHRVYVGTCSTLGNFLQMGFPPNHFTHVLIDEAGQCTEPESMVPMVLLTPKRGQVILSGDPHQLQAIVLNQYTCEHGLPISLMERILQHAPYRKDLMRFPLSSGFNPVLVTKLLYNYRALPSIMKTYSKLYYDDELLSKIPTEDSYEADLLARLLKGFRNIVNIKKIPKAHGCFFCGVMGENLQENDSPSWFNPVEARELFLTAVEFYRMGVEPKQIGILTPYVKQVKTVRTMFNAADLPIPKIGSVEEFQGQERDIMLISTVRSTESMLNHDASLSLGFIRCNKRINVAISRARSMMIIFGNPHLLSVDVSWCYIIRYCVKNNSYFGCELPQIVLDMQHQIDSEDKINE